MQIVEDDEIENVGIMDGFMEDIESLMEEITEDEGIASDSDEDMSEIMDRRPDSPEILMNNLRGDYRSIDARREELADLVGYNAATETPDDVLALLQPVLAQQQEGVAALGPLSSPEMTGLPLASYLTSTSGKLALITWAISLWLPINVPKAALSWGIERAN